MPTRCRDGGAITLLPPYPIDETNFDEELDKQGRNLFQNGASTLAGKKSIPEWSVNISRERFLQGHCLADPGMILDCIKNLRRTGLDETAILIQQLPGKVQCRCLFLSTIGSWDTRRMYTLTQLAGRYENAAIKFYCKWMPCQQFAGGLRRDTVVDTSVRPASQIDAPKVSGRWELGISLDNLLICEAGGHFHRDSEKEAGVVATVFQRWCSRRVNPVVLSRPFSESHAGLCTELNLQDLREEATTLRLQGEHSKFLTFH
ncbi:hypothetical protein SELMODRAFT_420008 [Selaginella moellendorffii]|uniref:Uncharacterized protein n=1 Tax=Selaginella moellendorffii TaxID=88036 RepID=D8SA94_SELML|nr:hypothetical protein SELMODRAFT_420008 [Selaginella moellendorffii]